MTTGWLIFTLGVLAGGIVFGTFGRMWGHHTDYEDGHLDGYQEHRAEVADRANAADARRAEKRQPPGAELQIRSKTASVPPWHDLHPRAVPGGGRPFPRASSRLATTADDIGPVFTPATETTRIPMRPQAGRDSGPGTETLTRIRATGEMLAITADTEKIIEEIIAGTWPPPREDSSA